MYIVKKSFQNPIFSHNKKVPFEATAAFNMSVIKVGKIYYGVYRAESSRDKLRKPEIISSIGIAESVDGINFTKRRQLVVPSENFDICGCEDPRITYFEGKFYIFYTALSGFPFGADNIKVAVAVTKDLKKIDSKYLVTPFNAKAMSLFPTRINGKITVAFSVDMDKGENQKESLRMSIAQVDDVEDLWDKKIWQEWYKNLDKNSLAIRRGEHDFYEGGARPVLTPYGWLFIYSYIQNYYGGGLDKIFGIEALLLDSKNPLKIIASTPGPIIVPSEDYELIGRVENICFPSGAILEDDDLSIYYGVVDAKTCVATLSLTDLLGTILPRTKDRWNFKRQNLEPIISPNSKNSFEDFATFNPAAIYLGGKVHILYRAMGKDNTSTVGYASSTDGINIDERLDKPIYVPRKDFEMKKNSGGNSGCEDPRLVQIGNYIYMFYTAYNGVDAPAVAVTKISIKNFLAKNWIWDEPFLISPSGIDDKDTCVFPEKIHGKYFVMHRIGIEICGDYIDDLDFEFERLEKCISVFGPRPNTWDSLKIGIATPPIKTQYGWLLLYHGISRSHHTYRVGAALLDLKDPSIVLSRTADPIFQPELIWEKEGIVNNVVFPCGACVLGKDLFIYYGGADKVVGVAKIEMELLLKSLNR